MRSSPGGTNLEDYHWSGGIYNDKFARYDKFYDTKHLYGPNSGTVTPFYPTTSHDKPIPVSNVDFQSPTTPIRLERFTIDTKEKLLLVIGVMMLLSIFLLSIDKIIRLVTCFVLLMIALYLLY
jgi:hypothetical protein